MSGKSISHLAVAVAVLLVAIVQWVVIFDRTGAAVWDWYKFSGYGGGGHITVGKNSQTIFYVLSAVAAAAGIVLARNWDTDGDQLLRRAMRIGAWALVVGLSFWTAILASPLASFR